MTIGSRIKELRTSKGIPQSDLADKINVSKQTLYKYEHDLITNIPSNIIESIANELNVTPAYLMGWDAVDYSIDRDEYILEIEKLVNNHKKIRAEYFQAYAELLLAAQNSKLEDVRMATNLLLRLQGKEIKNETTE